MASLAHMVHRHKTKMCFGDFDFRKTQLSLEEHTKFMLILLVGDKHMHYKTNTFCFVFRRVQSLEKQLLCYSVVYNGLAYGALQIKLLEGADVCKGLEDVVGSVRGFLAANK